MFQLSNVRNIASNVLDLVFVNGFDDIETCQAPVAITKTNGIVKLQPPIEISFEYYPEEKTPSEMVEVLLYDNENYDSILRQLNAINFALIFLELNVEDAFDYFYLLMGQLIKENIPTVRIKKNNDKPKWWTPELQRKKNRRDKAYKRKPKNELTEEYVKSLEEFNELRDKLYNITRRNFGNTLKKNKRNQCIQRKCIMKVVQVTSPMKLLNYLLITLRVYMKVMMNSISRKFTVANS